MVSSRKRGRQEMEEAPVEPKEPSLLERIRNMWEFANLAQWIFTFGQAVKIDENLDIEELEMECLKTVSTVLPEVGLALLKFVSSHRGLTPEIFDEYTRRQYVTRAPERNPYGVEEEPKNFNDFDVFTKIRVLQQLTQWTMVNPDRIRERMEEHKDIEQTSWRIEPFGWDSEDRTYIVLDDNRLYRRTDPPPPPPPAAKAKPKKNSKKAKAALRASKRRKISEVAESETEHHDEGSSAENQEEKKEYDGLGGMVWECVAITLDEFNAFLASIEKSRDPNEKELRKRIVDGVLPLLEKQEEARKRKQAAKERELLNIEKLAHAKRSSRIAGKMEQHKQEEEAREAERKTQADLAMAKKEQEKWKKLEKERESRMQTREQRLKEREARRILHEEELANLSEDSKKIENGQARLSERHLKAEIERKKQALKELTEDEDWVFDCICGAYGQIDDGTHSIACDKCNVWQHSKCVGVSQEQADREDFHFICKTCERRAKEAERAKSHPTIKLKFNRPGSASSGPLITNGSPASMAKANIHPILPLGSPQKVAKSSPASQPPSLSQSNSGRQFTSWQNGQSPSKQNAQYQSHSQSFPQMQATSSSASTPYQMRPLIPAASGSNASYTGPYAPYQNNGSPGMSPYGAPRPASSHVFSSPLPHSPTSLPPPVQPPVYTFMNGNTSNERSTHNTPVQSSPGKYPAVQGPPPLSSSNGHNPSAPYVLGNRPTSSGNEPYRPSAYFSSPLAAAPVLTPSVKGNTATTFSVTTSPALQPTPNLYPKSSPPQTGLFSTTQASHSDQVCDPGNSSTLPYANPGLSPTKHSPPRPPTSNGSFGSATPSILPPITSLSPSPQLQNLTPPVKHSEPEVIRPTGQTVAQ